jgi:hypothetical protein
MVLASGPRLGRSCVIPLLFDTDVRNMLVTQKFYSEPATLDGIIKAHLAKYASKTRRQWAEELGC